MAEKFGITVACSGVGHGFFHKDEFFRNAALAFSIHRLGRSDTRKLLNNSVDDLIDRLYGQMKDDDDPHQWFLLGPTCTLYTSSLGPKLRAPYPTVKKSTKP